jgi:hypothetical protein
VKLRCLGLSLATGPIVRIPMRPGGQGQTLEGCNYASGQSFAVGLLTRARASSYVNFRSGG